VDISMATGRLLLKEKSLGNTWKPRLTQYQSICGCQLQHRCYCSRLASVTIQLAPFATKIVDGNIDDLNAALYEELLAKIDFSAYNKLL
jgi:hypothetical protein